MPAPSLHVPLEEINLSDPAFWRAGEEYREAAFRTLRHEDPIRFFPEPIPLDPAIPQGPGYWALTRYDDVWHASRNPELFCSGKGSNIGDLPEFMLETLGSMINMDDPKHFRLRSIVSKGFTPKEVAKVEQYVKAKAAAAVDRLIEEFPDGHCDLVKEVAAPVPLQIICEMMGIPAADEAQIFAWTNTILGVGDPEYVTSLDDLMAALIGMSQYATELGQSRLDRPTDDITSVLMHAVVDGERLTTQEFASFFILLVVAGNETTRTAISHGVKLLTDHPDQRAIWFGDWEAVTRTAVEEIVRYSTPVIHFRRTATEDTELSGVKIAAGQKVVLWYNSANRDETKWADPWAFDVRRELQPQQVGFGAGGPHFCLGANLARREIAVMFDEIRRRIPDLAAVGEPDYLQSSFIHGIKRLPCAWTPPR
jgi:cytochrome P450